MVNAKHCRCVNCQEARALADAQKRVALLEEHNAALSARLVELARGNSELLLERNAERDAKHATAEHRDRLIETVRGLRAEADSLRAQLKAEHEARLLAAWERDELRRHVEAAKTAVAVILPRA